MKPSSFRPWHGWIPAAALVVALVGWTAHRAVRRTLEADLKDEILMVLNANVAALEIWLDTQARLASVIASDPALRTRIEAAVAKPPEAVAPVPGEGGGRVRRVMALPGPQAEVQAALDARLTPSGYGAALVLATNLQVVATSQRARNRLGETIEGEHAARVQQALESGKPTFVTPFKAGFGRGLGRGGGGDRTGRPTGGREGTNGPGKGPGGGPGGGPRRPMGELNLMEVIAPVSDAKGTAVGVVVFVLRPEDEFTRVLSIARPGQSGETFAFDAGGRLVSASRFDAQLRRAGLLTTNTSVSSALNVELRDPGLDVTRLAKALTESARTNLASRPLVRMVDAATSGATNEPGFTLEPERDYRGVDVVGAWRWLPERHFGVATKIDAAEAFRPLQVLRLVVLALLLMLALAMVVMLVAAHAGTVWRTRFDEERLKARQLGQYQLVAKIGEGAMGVVYRARHAFLRRETAVKLLLPDRADDALVRQFEQEVRLTCRLEHPNTIQIYDYGRTADGIFYYAMELLHGLTWHQLVEQHGPQSPGRVVHLLAQAAQSLREAHQAGLIHRDIKPGNLFLCQRGGIPDTVKVLDFGLVRRMSGEAGAVEAGSGVEAGAEPWRRFLGTPLYMAPETIRQPGFGDARSDLYALAAVGHVMLTGRALFDGATTEDVWRQQQTEEPPSPSGLAPHPVSAELEGLLMRSLAKEPGERPASMDAFLAGLMACPEWGGWTAGMQEEWWRLHGPQEESAGEVGGVEGDVRATMVVPATRRAV